MAKIPVNRGDIVLVDLKGAVGGEKKNDAQISARPCIVVQNDVGNGVSPLTIVAIQGLSCPGKGKRRRARGRQRKCCRMRTYSND